jgi:hypothetical protein
MQEELDPTREFIVLVLDSIKKEAAVTLKDISEEELHWEPLSAQESDRDRTLPAEKKRVWRVYFNGERWTYDYGGDIQPPAFTTIAWIMNHIAQTSEMYLYCIRSGKPVGAEKNWDDLPVFPDVSNLRNYIFQTIEDTLLWINTIPDGEFSSILRQKTPAPWGELRPTMQNLHGGVLQHALQHLMQIAVRLEYIRYWHK